MGAIDQVAIGCYRLGGATETCYIIRNYIYGLLQTHRTSAI